MSRVPHPIPYQGSKRNLASAILAHLPERCSRLVEPFAGSAAISLAAAHQQRASRFWINDAHAPLSQLWQAILDRPEELAASYERLWQEQRGQERAYFDQVREDFNRTHRPDCFLYLLARCAKAAVRYNAEGQFNNSPDNRRRGARPEVMRARIAGASKLLAGRTEVSACDYREVLAHCTPDDVIYMDPPYRGVSGGRDRRYGQGIDHREFCDALADLNRRGCRYLVSYDGRTGAKSYGEPLPDSLGLAHLELPAGRSSQATLLGLSSRTYESLYLSPSLPGWVARP